MANQARKGVKSIQLLNVRFSTHIHTKWRVLTSWCVLAQWDLGDQLGSFFKEITEKLSFFHFFQKSTFCSIWAGTTSIWATKVVDTWKNCMFYQFKKFQFLVYIWPLFIKIWIGNAYSEFCHFQVFKNRSFSIWFHMVVKNAEKLVFDFPPKLLIRVFWYFWPELFSSCVKATEWSI